MDSDLTPLDKRLLDAFQRDFPLSPEPYAVMANSLGVSEEVLLERLRALQEQGVISRVGVVLQPGRVGVSTLAAMAVPPERLESVASLVNTFSEINHNYAREDTLNLWFVITAMSQPDLENTVQRIGAATGLPVYSMPMVNNFHVDLGFPLSKQEWHPNHGISHP
ncbi:MAG: AsnC family transcriptional regulator [Magnetococcales bacterium]|nr:AsnC family transcriptional regulator [Magnetococcales bacterium]